MEELSSNISLLAGSIIALIGTFVFNLLMIFPKVKDVREISIKKWWIETRIRYVFSLMMIANFLYVNWYYDTLTIEHSFFLGLVGNLIVDRIIKSTKWQPQKK